MHLSDPLSIKYQIAAMDEYSRDVLTRAVDGFVYVERTEQSGRVRQGLVGKIDLEAYSYEKGARPAIRPSERTVTERIPPRMAVRRGAALETPHVMMLADDPGCTLVEPIGARKSELKKLYEGELMQGGGHIAGWAVEDPAMLAQIDTALAALGSQEAFDARYPQARGAKPLTLAVGDGNHSLAAAKACWEELKATLTPEERESHPARWCLAEVCNVHSPAIEIEPIHRVLFNVDCGAVLLALIAWSDSNMAGICFGDSKQQAFTLAGPHVSNVLSFEDPVAPLTVGTVDEFIEYFMARHSEARVDYVHDEPAVRALTRQGGVAFLLPPFEKSDLFKGIVMVQTTMQQTLSRLQQDDLTTLSLLERVTKLERAASSQGSHNMDLNMLMKTTYSQSGEDAILAYLFAVLGIPFAKCTYLDLGANRPKEMSNTYFFYEQGATGTLIEANPALIPALQKERSGDVILNRCIAPKSGDVIPFHVMNVDGLSTPEDVTELLANHPDLKLLETVNVETVSVNDLFAQMHAVPVFVNIDIEGMEMEILRSIDFTKYRPLVLILEMIPYSKKLPVGQKNPEILAFLQEKGYVEYAFTGINSIFIDAAQVK